MNTGLALLQWTIAGLLWVLFELTPLIAFLYGLYFCLSLPHRRRDRARLFLDLVESGLRDGRSVEETVVAASASRAQSLGVRFHLLASYLEQGCRLREALEK